MGALLAIAAVAAAAIAGWKIANARGLDPNKAPSFDSQRQYIRRGALVGLPANFVLTYALWLLFATPAVEQGSITVGEAILFSTLPAAIMAPVGALIGAVYGWIWYQTDSVRRGNQLLTAEPTTAPKKASPDVTAVILPKGLGIPRTQNTTGDATWDDFHRSATQ